MYKPYHCSIHFTAQIYRRGNGASRQLATVRIPVAIRQPAQTA